MLKKFGGHAMAAGLTLKRSDFDAFRTAFDDEVKKHLGPEDLQGVVFSDGELMADEISLEVAETLRSGGPWGQGFPEPVFDGVFDIAGRRVVGEKHLKLLLQVPGDGHLIDAIAFNIDNEAWPEGLEQIHIAYKLDVNEYRGQRNAQLIVEHVDIN
jgi:single-stranded-DNA-specific exonuclease